MTSSSRGRRALLIVVVLLAIPVLGAGGIHFWIQRAADRKWADARLRIQELMRAFPDTLPPPPSSEISKELQIHFVAAIREAVRRNNREEEARILVRQRQGGEGLDVVLGDAQEFLDRLHEGARRCAATPAEFPPGWRGEWDANTLRFILNCCVLRARRLREKDAPDGAAETLLDSLQLARFWAASGKGSNRIDALYSLDDPLDELRDLLARKSPSRQQLQKIEHELEAIDGAWESPAVCFERTLARWGEWLEALDIEDFGYLNGAPYRWRWLLPKLLMKAEAFEFYDRHLQRLLADGARSYPEMALDLDRLSEQEKASKNPIIADTFFGSRLHLAGFDRMAQIRLLRVAAGYRASGEFLTLKDPFGVELLHSRTGNRMRFWSPGPDGRDDGGNAGSEGRWTWHTTLPGAPFPQPPKDIVIEVELKDR